jgi:RHS repeat-associated protein
MHDSILAGNIWQGRGTYDVRLNPTLTGSVTYADITHASSIVGGGGSQTLGRGVLSSEGVQNRFGYAGYRYDHHLSGGAGAGRHLYHVRHRVYQAHIGRWATRDFLGYVQGMSLYQYVRSQPILRTDPSGLLSSWRTGCVACASFHGGYSTHATKNTLRLPAACGNPDFEPLFHDCAPAFFKMIGTCAAATAATLFAAKTCFAAGANPALMPACIAATLAAAAAVIACHDAIMTYAHCVNPPTPTPPAPLPPARPKPCDWRKLMDDQIPPTYRHLRREMDCQMQYDRNSMICEGLKRLVSRKCTDADLQACIAWVNRQKAACDKWLVTIFPQPERPPPVRLPSWPPPPPVWKPGGMSIAVD